jgi:hypothetical protein
VLYPDLFRDQLPLMTVGWYRRRGVVETGLLPSDSFNSAKATTKGLWFPGLVVDV